MRLFFVRMIQILLKTLLILMSNFRRRCFVNSLTGLGEEFNLINEMVVSFATQAKVCINMGIFKNNRSFVIGERKGFISVVV